MGITRNVLTANAGEYMMPGDERFELIDPVHWHGIAPPERKWTLRDWLPRGRAAYITGSGGAGKSLLGQQAATCVSLGMPFFGIETTRCAAIYLTCEDDRDELQIRQSAICRALGVQHTDLLGLHLCSLFGEPDNRLIAFGRDGEVIELPAWIKLLNTIDATRASFVILDNTSHLFGGSEIDRAQVTAFANQLNGLSADIDGTVMLIGHPNKAGDEYSGVTAWSNAFRARLFFDEPKGDQAHGDPDARQLSLPKANYSKKGATIDVRWHEGAFVRDEDLPPSIAEELRQVTAHSGANEAFMRCLDAAAKQRRAVSHVPGVNYAPKVFERMTEGRGFALEAFAGAMERLVYLGVIAFDQPLWKGDNYHWKRGIKRAEIDPPTPANPKTETAENRHFSSANPSRQPSANPPPTPQKTVRQPPPANPLSPMGIRVGPLEGPTPIPEDELDWGDDEEVDR